jgi:methylphosphotriester-DNA--protein-cysteine methyltransferase
MTTYSAAVTTGIYCRPGCAARPLAQNTRTFELAAAAEAEGFRACHRCRPPKGSSARGLSEVMNLSRDMLMSKITFATSASNTRLPMSPGLASGNSEIIT